MQLTRIIAGPTAVLDSDFTQLSHKQQTVLFCDKTIIIQQQQNVNKDKFHDQVNKLFITQNIRLHKWTINISRKYGNMILLDRGKHFDNRWQNINTTVNPLSYV